MTPNQGRKEVTTVPEDAIISMLNNFTKVMSDQLQQLRSDLTTEVREVKSQLGTITNKLPDDYARKQDMNDLETEVRDLRNSLDPTYLTRRENDGQQRAYDEFRKDITQRIVRQEDIQAGTRLKTLEDAQSNNSTKRFGLFQMVLSVLLGSGLSFILGIISYIILKLLFH